MKPVLVGAVIAGALIALVLLMFRPGAEETPFGSGIETAETSLEDPGEIIPGHPEASNSRDDFTGVDIFGGTTLEGPDPRLLRVQLEAAGVDVHQGARNGRIDGADGRINRRWIYRFCALSGLGVIAPGLGVI